jgi:uncharacterized protein (TIGR04255 family)
MATPRHLRKAPIIEALIDIRVEPPTAATADTFRDLKEVLANRYPVVNDQRGASARIEIRRGKVITEVDQLGSQGLSFHASDGKTVAQFRADGFTLNRLKPYQDWPTLWDEARSLWPLYVERAKPAGVTRLALRYINELQLPLEPGEDFGLYLAAPPNIPADLTQSLGDFLVRVQLHQPSNDLAATVTQKLAPKTPDAPVRVWLDIDVYRVAPFTVEVSVIEPVFGQLHDFKNSIFFSYITDRTVGLYE